MPLSMEAAGEKCSITSHDSKICELCWLPLTVTFLSCVEKQSGKYWTATSMGCKGWNGWECYLSLTPMQFPICIPFTWGPMLVFTLTLLSISKCVGVAEETKTLCRLCPSRTKYAYLYSELNKSRSLLCAQSWFHLELTHHSHS